MTMTAKEITAAITRRGKPARVAVLQRFFKTGVGEYAEGDVFIGLTVPECRALAKTYRDAEVSTCVELLSSSVHEIRLTALFIFLEKLKRADEALRKKIVGAYLKNTHHVNNWDLVDASAHYIVGADALARGDDSVIRKLARSKSLWERRIAIIATFAHIRAGHFRLALDISRGLLADKHDLIHKAVGWMLREIGKRDIVPLRAFLDEHAGVMPRTMLRYAIEKMSERERKMYLKK